MTQWGSGKRRPNLLDSRLRGNDAAQHEYSIVLSRHRVLRVLKHTLKVSATAMPCSSHTSPQARLSLDIIWVND
jgi:hypothetical protein